MIIGSVVQNQAHAPESSSKHMPKRVIWPLFSELSPGIAWQLLKLMIHKLYSGFIQKVDKLYSGYIDYMK